MLSKNKKITFDEAEPSFFEGIWYQTIDKIGEGGQGIALKTVFKGLPYAIRVSVCGNTGIIP